MAAVSITPALEGLCSRAIDTPDTFTDEEASRVKAEISGGYISYSSLVILTRFLDRYEESATLREVLRGSKVTIPAMRPNAVEVSPFGLFVASVYALILNISDKPTLDLPA